MAWFEGIEDIYAEPDAPIPEKCPDDLPESVRVIYVRKLPEPPKIKINPDDIIFKPDDVILVVKPDGYILIDTWGCMYQ